jgi:hypothetical protein
MDEDKTGELQDKCLTAGSLREVLNNRYWDIAQFPKIFKFTSGHIDLKKSTPAGCWWAQSKYCHVFCLHNAMI